MSICEAHCLQLSTSETGDVCERSTSAERVCLDDDDVLVKLKTWLNILRISSGLRVLEGGWVGGGESVLSKWRRRGTEFGSPNSMMLSGRAGLWEKREKQSKVKVQRWELYKNMLPREHARGSGKFPTENKSC